MDQSLNLSIVDPFDTVDVVHTVTFPEGTTLGVSVEYMLIPRDSQTYADINNGLELTIEMIEVFPSTDAMEWDKTRQHAHAQFIHVSVFSYCRITISNLGNIFNPSDNLADENDTAVITSKLELSQSLNFSILAITTYQGNDPVSISNEACIRFLETKINYIEIDDPLWPVMFLFIGILIGSSSVMVCLAAFVLKKKKRKRNTIAPALIAAIMDKVCT